MHEHIRDINSKEKKEKKRKETKNKYLPKNEKSANRFVALFVPAQFPPRGSLIAWLQNRRNEKLCPQSELHIVHSSLLTSPEKFRKRSFMAPSSSSPSSNRLEDRWEAARKIAYTGRRRLVIKKSAAPLIRIHRSFLSPLLELLHLEGGEVWSKSRSKRNFLYFCSSILSPIDKGRKMCARRWKTGNQKSRSRISMLVRAEMPVNERSISSSVDWLWNGSRKRFLGLPFFVVCPLENVI